MNKPLIVSAKGAVLRAMCLCILHNAVLIIREKNINTVPSPYMYIKQVSIGVNY